MNSKCKTMRPEKFYRPILVSKYICIISLFFIIVTNSCFGELSVARIRRSPGLFENIKPLSLPRLDPSSVFNLTKIQEQINKLGSFSEGLEKALELEKKARLGLQEFVDSIKDRIESLENAVLPDENNYYEESNSCGGVIVSQTGKIGYKVDTSYEHWEKCVWTIRCNYRSLVKVQLTSHGLESDYDYIAVTEVNANKEPKTSKLDHKGKYVFDGPLFLVTFVSDGSGLGLGFSLEFEGVGRNINKDIVYNHFHATGLSGTISAENLTHSEASLLTARNPTQTFTTFVVNPDLKNVSQLSLNVNQELLNLQPGTCEDSSLQFYDYLEVNNTRNRCCGTSCTAPTFKNDNGFVLATLNQQFASQKDSTFQFDWNTRDPVQRSDSIDTCGGTVSGRLGRISYQLESTYANNERCLWVIKPTGKSKVKVMIRSATLVDGYDFVSVSIIDQNSDIVTTQLDHGPTYNFSGPTILITFYSDDSNVGNGFELDWEEFGDSIKNQDSVNEPVYFDQDSGTVSLSLESPSYQLVVINSKYLDGSSIELKVNSVESQSQPEQEVKQQDSVEQDCDDGSVYVYGNDEYNFTLAREYCVFGNEIIPEEFSAVGGIFILLVKVDSPASITKLELTWRKGSLPIKPSMEGLQYVNSTDECGGVLIGDAGHIEYKLTSPYEDNARCTWIVESSQLSKMSFKLIKDGFESCCDYLVVTPLNVETGTLGKSVIISRENRIQSFTTPVVFITFVSDASLGYSGFRLDFSTSGNLGTNRFGFSHHIFRETPGNASFTQASEEDGLLNENETQNNKIVTYVLNSNDGEAIKSITIHAQVNYFQADETIDCQKDNLVFFQVQNPSIGETISELVGCSDDESNSCTCVPRIEKSFKMDAYFIAIFKPLNASNDKPSFNFGWSVLEQPAVEN